LGEAFLEDEDDYEDDCEGPGTCPLAPSS
jgi:hypothetical protein